jgi:serine/threonine protein kinase
MLDTSASLLSLPFIGKVYPESLMLGRRIGHYRVVRKVGEGGMGVVYEAVHEQLKLRAAVKVLFASCDRDSPEAVRFFAEARATSAVQHSSLVRLFDFGQLDDGTVYMMMEYLEGETLREHLGRSGKLPIEQVLPLVEQMAAALAVVHAAGIIHRDLNQSLLTVENCRSNMALRKDCGNEIN